VIVERREATETGTLGGSSRHGSSVATAAEAPAAHPMDRLRGLLRRGWPRDRRVQAGAAAVLFLVVVVALMPRGSIDDGWRVVHDGYGRAGVEDTEDGEVVHYLSPTVATSADATHAALLVTEEDHSDIDLTLRMRTVEQLRQGSPPNPWEVGWVLWRYTDDRHFYYLTLKPNGWELGKRDPAYPGGQRFLASDTTPVFYFNEWYDVRIVHDGDRITVWVDGLWLTTFEDRERPYDQGAVGLYSEDAYAQFHDVRIAAPPDDLPTGPPTAGGE
jgi:hypothetical protein